MKSMRWSVGLVLALAVGCGKTEAPADTAVAPADVDKPGVPETPPDAAAAPESDQGGEDDSSGEKA